MDMKIPKKKTSVKKSRIMRKLHNTNPTPCLSPSLVGIRYQKENK